MCDLIKQPATFELDREFVESYRNIPPPWGFGLLSELTYLRTYSRIKADGENEQWFETVERVVNGTYRMQERHILSNRLGWNEERAQRSAQEMYDRIFRMKFLPPGRGLWAMGSPLTESRGLFAALQNCAFVSTADIQRKHSKPFLFLMDLSMCGAGVGFDTLGSGKVTIQQPGNSSTRKRWKTIYPDLPEKQTTFDWKGESVVFDYEVRDGVFVIPDTREGWVISTMYILDAFLQGYSLPQMDYSLIRPANVSINGFGGMSSGPDPLIQLHNGLIEFLTKHIDRAINSEIITTIMNMIGVCVVMGNIRRTAEIVFGSPQDINFLNLKSYTWDRGSQSYIGMRADRACYGWTSNNSVFAEIGMDYHDCAERTRVNGEPGYEWLDNARAYGRMCDLPSNLDMRVAGANPCFAPGTLIHTSDGHYPVETLIGKNVDVWDGMEWVKTRFRITGENQPVLKITLQDGTEERVTPNHSVILENGTRLVAQDLQPGMRLQIGNAPHSYGSETGKGAYLKGFLVADGNRVAENRLALWLYAPKFMCQERLIQSAYEIDLMDTMRSDTISVPGFWSDKGDLRRCMQGLAARRESLTPWVTTYRERIPSGVFVWGYDSKCEFIAGVMDGDGTAADTSNGFMYQISSIHRGWLLDFQRLLKTIGVQSKLSLNRKAGRTQFRKDQPTYPTRKSWRLTISQSAAIILSRQVKFERLMSFADRVSVYQCRPRWNEVISVEPDGFEDKVYCCTVPTNHSLALSSGIQIGQCVEQSLESYEMCCLVENFPYRCDNEADFIRTLKFSYLYAKTVTLGQTHWAETNQVMLRNRRIGCSLAGIQQFVSARGLDSLKQWCEAGYQAICRWDQTYSEWLCINRSLKKTSIKPGGTVPLLSGATPGMHWPENTYYIRRIKISIHSPLIPPLRAAGYHVELDVLDSSSYVVEIPVKLEGNVRPVSQVSIWEQVAMAAFLQRYWADNQVSCTVTFNPETEGDQVERVLEYFQYHLKGISFLPKTPAGAYAQMPYEEITEEEYDALTANLKPVQFGTVRTEDRQADQFCDSDRCVLN